MCEAAACQHAPHAQAHLPVSGRRHAHANAHQKRQPKRAVHSACGTGHWNCAGRGPRHSFKLPWQKRWHSGTFCCGCGSGQYRGATRSRIASPPLAQVHHAIAKATFNVHETYRGASSLYINNAGAHGAVPEIPTFPSEWRVLIYLSPMPSTCAHELAAPQQPTPLVQERPAGSHRPGWNFGTNMGRTASPGHLGSMENAAHGKRKAIFTFLGPPGRFSWAHGGLRERRARAGG